MNQGFADMFFKCAYHANVMNRLEQTSRRTVFMMTAMMQCNLLVLAGRNTPLFRKRVPASCPDAPFSKCVNIVIFARKSSMELEIMKKMW